MPYNRSSFDKEQFEEIIKSPNYDDIHAIIHSFIHSTVVTLRLTGLSNENISKKIAV